MLMCQPSDALATGGNEANDFWINQTTGLINMTGYIDFESINNYTLTVEVWDIRDPDFTVGGVLYGPHIVNTTVTINVIGKLLFVKIICILSFCNGFKSEQNIIIMLPEMRACSRRFVRPYVRLYFQIMSGTYLLNYKCYLSTTNIAGRYNTLGRSAVHIYCNNLE